MALTAEHLIVIGRGRVIADVGADEFVRRHSRQIVRVRSPQADELSAALLGPGVTITSLAPGLLEIEGLSAQQVGERAAEGRLTLHELVQQQVSLEEAFMTLTQDDVEFRSQASLDSAAVGQEDLAA